MSARNAHRAARLAGAALHLADLTGYLERSSRTRHAIGVISCAQRRFSRRNRTQAGDARRSYPRGEGDPEEHQRDRSSATASRFRRRWRTSPTSTSPTGTPPPTKFAGSRSLDAHRDQRRDPRRWQRPTSRLSPGECSSQTGLVDVITRQRRDRRHRPSESRYRGCTNSGADRYRRTARQTTNPVIKQYTPIAMAQQQRPQQPQISRDPPSTYCQPGCRDARQFPAATRAVAPARPPLTPRARRVSTARPSHANAAAIPRVARETAGDCSQSCPRPRTPRRMCTAAAAHRDLESGRNLVAASAPTAANKHRRDNSQHASLMT